MKGPDELPIPAADWRIRRRVRLFPLPPVSRLARHRARLVEAVVGIAAACQVAGAAVVADGERVELLKAPE